ncbi:MAG: 6-carboxytetrahydropterin synthase [Desulfobacterales bacterium]|nr:MAG: 6-carboxytetrahydropterin synthase [Desulfobacterales bacterium]
MYTVAVKRDFIARHYLIGGDWGDENEPHAHHYVIEVRLEGLNLDSHGYLTDICDIESALDARVTYFRDKMLNELPEFVDLNPSIEHFARILCQAMAANIQTDHLKAMAVKLWESESAWTQFRQTF